MIDKTKWAIVKWGPLTSSGEDEILLTCQYKYTAERVARDLGYTNREQYKIMRIQTPLRGSE